VYPTADGYIAIAMTPLGRIEELLGLPALAAYREPKSWFTARDAIKQIIAERLASAPTAQWLDVLEPADIWCAKVLDWPELLESEGFKALDMLQTVTREDNVSVLTTRSPLRVDGKRAQTSRAAPLVGEQSAAIRKEFGL
jgi:crotonobetainyl-CoA:carnitine CoA-transferase CaiB-like acyl-CoA transferase